jgi:hypothetical protein
VISEREDLLAELDGLIEGLTKQHTARLHLPRWGPVERLDLLEVEPDEAVTMPESVIHEGERELLAERHEPEGQLRELNSSRVLVDAIEALLCD